MSFSKWIRGGAEPTNGVVYLDPSLYGLVYKSLHANFTYYGRLASRLPDLNSFERYVLACAAQWSTPEERVEANEILRRYLPREE